MFVGPTVRSDDRTTGPPTVYKDGDRDEGLTLRKTKPGSGEVRAVTEKSSKKSGLVRVKIIFFRSGVYVEINIFNKIRGCLLSSPRLIYFLRIFNYFTWIKNSFTRLVKSLRLLWTLSKVSRLC